MSAPAELPEVSLTELARQIHECAHLTGEFVLRSGAVSHEYFDKYRFESDPVLLRSIVEAMAALLPGDVDALAGLELGGVPLATMLGQVTGLPVFFVRKQPKAYGTRQFAEGGPVAGRRLLIVEDVITSGGQVVASAADLRGAGAEADTVVCVIDREAGGPVALADAGLELRALLTLTGIRDAVG